jgi:hypothetical protein
MGKEKQEMKEKNWKEMNGWEKAWEATQIVAGWAVGIGTLLLILFGGGKPSRGGGSSGGHSIWMRGSGGKKPGSWSSGRHR